jgi:hypothetical protein
MGEVLEGDAGTVGEEILVVGGHSAECIDLTEDIPLLFHYCLDLLSVYQSNRCLHQIKLLKG